MEEKRVWGIHTMDDNMFLHGNKIAIGWPEMGDLSMLNNSRDAFKAAYAEAYPDAKPGSIPTCAGMLYRFVNEVQVGDYAKECELENIYISLQKFIKDPSYRNKEVLVALADNYDLNQKSLLGLYRYSEYEVTMINFLFIHATAMNCNVLKAYLYEHVGLLGRLQKNVAYMGLGDKLEINYFEKLLPSLKLYYICYLNFIVDKDMDFADKIMQVIGEALVNIDDENLFYLTHAFVTMMNDISYFECKKRNGIWAFSRSELLKLFELEAKLVSDIGEHPMERPLKGVLMTTISNFILKSRYDYNSDFVAKYISSEVALKSISNHEIWIRETTLLNDSREEKVIPELFQDITWMQTDWAKNIEFTRTRHYYVSSFCKNYDDDTMKKKYGECVYGYKNDRLVELLAPIHLGHNEEEQTYPAFSQVIAFDVLYDKEMAKEEILFLCKIISLFKMDDSEKHDFLEEIMQYWILSVKDENWEEERERRYVIFMYDGYDYIDIAYQESDFLKVKTTIFLLPDFILGNNPAKYQIRASLDNKRQATAMKDYDLCPVCLSADFDSVLEAPCICKICGNGEVNRIKIQGTAKRI